MKKESDIKIAFGKYQEGIYLDNLKTYELLSKGIQLYGIDELPISLIVQEISCQFYDWEHYNENGWRKSNREQFEIYTTSQLIKIDCLNVLDGKDMNKFPDIMVDFNCPIFDAKINRRFDEWVLCKGENYYI